MYELIKLTENNYYIESPAKIGIIHIGGDEVVAIDSGNDKVAGKRIKKITDTNKWKLSAVYNTHSHADHIGGNQYLQNETGCKIYAPETEVSFVKNPILEPAFLYGGNPPSSLRRKFLMAPPSDAETLTENVLPEGLETVELGGHAFNMVGFKTSEDVVFLADCLSSRETLEKYKMVYITDVEAYLETLEKVKLMKAKFFVPSHAAVTDDITPLAQLNIDKTLETGECIMSLLKTPKTFEELLKDIFEYYSLSMSFEQYALVGSTLKSYLTWLSNSERLTFEIDNNRLVWREKVFSAQI